jgi:hypothetical protein
MWNASLGSSNSEQALKRPPAIEFTPGKILIDRCEYYPMKKPGRKGDLRGGWNWEASWTDRMAGLLSSITRGMRGASRGLWYNPVYKHLRSDSPSDAGNQAKLKEHILKERREKKYDGGDLTDGGVLSRGRQREGDVECCLDAVDEVTGELLWSHCYNQGQACRTGDARSAISFIMNVLLVVQILAMVGGLGFVLGYRVLCSRPFNRGRMMASPDTLQRDMIQSH